MLNQLHLWPKAKPVERLRWSISRDRRLRDCPRKYYLHHYASAGGKRAAKESVTHDIYMLKHLRNRFMWVGEVVHELVEQCLHSWKRGQEVSVETLVQRGTRRMRAHYAESVQGMYRHDPNHAWGLVEHEYAEAVSRQDWQSQRDRMERCLRHFFALPMTQVIRETPPWSWLALEATGSFEVDGATVLVKPDFAWRAADGHVVLVDWKTGRPHADERMQLAVYGIFAQKVWGLGNASLEARLVYLDTGTVEHFELGPDDLAEAEENVRQSVATMGRLAALSPSRETISTVAPHFPQTTDVARCQRCAFRRICGRDASGQAADSLVPTITQSPAAAVDTMDV